MNTITRGTNKSIASKALIYPLDMKDDINEKSKGQDRIEFTSYQYAKKLRDEKDKETLPDVDPFPEPGERLKEKNQYKLKSINLGGVFKEVERVFLPIQDKIQDQNGVDWGAGELNEFQRKLANLSYGVMIADKDIEDKTKESLNAVLNTAGFGNAMRLKAVEEAISTQGLLTRATGNILNPNLELLFSKPTLRPFNFNFKLSPRNRTEAGIVKAIIKFFKKGMAPRITNNSTLFLESPLVFGIKYLQGNTTTHQGLNLIKKCALTNFVVDYTPNSSYMTYDDGTMTSYVLNMTLQELLPIYDLDYDETDYDIINHPIGY